MLNTLRDMTFGAKMSDKSLSQADQKSIYEGMRGRAELRVAFDHMRAGILPPNQAALEFIRQAHRRMKR